MVFSIWNTVGMHQCICTYINMQRYQLYTLSLWYSSGNSSKFVKYFISCICVPSKCIYKKKVQLGLFVGLPAAGSACPCWLPRPALTQRKEFSPTSTWYVMLCWYSWEACPFLKRNRGEVDAVWGEGVKGELRRIERIVLSTTDLYPEEEI